MKNFLKKLGKYLVYPKACMVVALVVAALFMPHFAQAACTSTESDATTGEPIYTDSSTGAPCTPSTTTTTTTSSSTSTPSSVSSSQMVKDLADFLAVMIRFLNSLLWPFLIIIGDLMDVDMIIGPGMEGRMIAIYNQIRNLVNIAFVLVLIAVAFYNVLGLGGGEGELAIKTALPKVVLGLILVNFTLPIGRVLLDMTNVGTNIAFGLPNIVDGYDFAPELKNFTNEVCFKGEDTSSTTGTWLQYSSKEADKATVPIQTQFLCADTNEDDLYDDLNSIIKTSYFSDLNKNNLGLIMAVNMGKLGALNLLKEGTINSFEDLTVNMIFVTLMFLVFATSYIVMGIVLLTRVVVLWIALALSPLAVLMYVVPQVKEWAGGGGDLQKKVIKHLISPIIMGVTLSFGYLLMDAWNNTAGSSNALGSLAVNNVVSAQFLVSGIDDLPKLILAIASIVVVWTGIWASASDTFAQGITDGIKGFGDQVKDFAYKLPMSIPTVALGVSGDKKEQNISPMALKLWADSAMSGVSNGEWARNQLTALPEGTTIAGIPFHAGNLNSTPEAIHSDLRSLTTDIAQSSKIDPDQASRVAQRLMDSVKSKDSTLTGGDQTSAVAKLEGLKARLAQSDQTALGELRTFLAAHQENPKELGMEKSELERLQSAFRDGASNKTFATPPAGGGTAGGGTTHTAPAAVATAIGQITPTNAAVASVNTGLSALPAVTPLSATPTSAEITAHTAAVAARANTTTAMTTLVADVTAAKTALDALQANYTPANLTTAKAAVQKATTGAHALQTDPTIAADPTLLGYANTAHAALNGMNTTIAALTPPTP